MSCYIPSTHITRIADTVEFISTVIPIPRTSSEDYLRQSITDSIALLVEPNPTVTPFSFGDDTQNSVKNRETPQPRHPCTKTHQENTNSYFPSAYITMELTAQPTVVALHITPATRVASYTASVLRVAVPEQPSHPK